jgi:hypothetical protein
MPAPSPAPNEDEEDKNVVERNSSEQGAVIILYGFFMRIGHSLFG